MSKSGDGSSSEQAGAPPAESADDLTAVVGRARRGFRKDVAALIAALDDGRLYVPLARSIAGVPEGVEVEMTGDLKLSPHLIEDDEGVAYACVFTSPTLLERAAELMGFQTDGGPLEYVALPGRMVLDVALELVDGKTASALLLNATHETELMLRREELGSIAQGRAIPLVGYVSEIPFSPDEKLLISELDGPLSPEVIATIEAVLGEHPPAPRYVLRQTFNAERDLEPHLTLNLISDDSERDLVPIAERLAEVLEGKLPPPGYIDILFNDAALR